MKIFKMKIAALLSVLVLTGSCTHDFMETNTNPNTATQALPASLLSPALYEMVTYNLGRAKALNNELMQVTVTISATNDIHRYDVRATYSDGPYNKWYKELNNFRDMYKNAEKLNDEFFMGVALILDSWTMSLLVDVYGDVPDSEACLGQEKLYQPKFDSQKDIYLKIYENLEKANQLLATADITKSQRPDLDLLYGGTNISGTAAQVTSWRKFGNSLYLRLLMHMSNRADDSDLKIQARVKNMLDNNSSNYPLFASNDDSAILEFTPDIPLQSPFKNQSNYDFNGSTGLADFFVDNLNNWKDPRLKLWATEASLGAYWGMQSGYESGNTPDPGSRLNLALRDEPKLGNIMNYGELQFLIAEAGVRSWTNNDPEKAYLKGIESSIYMWVDTTSDKTVFPKTKFDEYVNQEALKWDNGEAVQYKVKKIMNQKYYSLFFTDFQQWCDYRRTGFPEIPRGPGIPSTRSMPSRLKYPVYIQNLNKENYQKAVQSMGGDDIYTKLWWQP